VFKTLVTFSGADGGNPTAALVQGIDGNLYGTTNAYGPNLGGSVFKMTPSGSLTVLYNFCAQPNCVDGSRPNSMVLGSDGNFYGTTNFGGSANGGIVFKITPEGTFKTLYSFCALTNCIDGNRPNGLMLGNDGDFYGTTNFGGSANSGVVFKITSEFALRTIYSFCSQSNCSDGALPVATVIQATDGNLYGTTEEGGANGSGTVFKVTLMGALTTLYSFCSQPNCADGATHSFKPTTETSTAQPWLGPTTRARFSQLPRRARLRRSTPSAL
jgi:uncharacterized repeat protein (TIGR03803 family)